MLKDEFFIESKGQKNVIEKCLLGQNCKQVKIFTIKKGKNKKKKVLQVKKVLEFFFGGKLQAGQSH